MPIHKHGRAEEGVCNRIAVLSSQSCENAGENTVLKNHLYRITVFHSPAASNQKPEQLTFPVEQVESCLHTSLAPQTSSIFHKTLILYSIDFNGRLKLNAFRFSPRAIFLCLSFMKSAKSIVRISYVFQFCFCSVFFLFLILNSLVVCTWVWVDGAWNSVLCIQFTYLKERKMKIKLNYKALFEWAKIWSNWHNTICACVGCLMCIKMCGMCVRRNGKQNCRLDC